ncbi:MAG: trigger factor [Chloroflexi bacterium]|nr:trigger factor [Chloroflexota bacterium]
MKVTKEKIEESQAFLTIEMEPAEVEVSLEKSYQRLVRRTKVPGFRPGKAPRAILERYLGRERLLDEALQQMVPEAYEKAIKEQEIEAVAQPKIEIVKTEPVVEFKAIVPLKPEVKLGDYHQMQMTPEAVSVTEENVNAVLEQLRHEHATWEPVERSVDFGDMVVMDVWSTAGGEPFINQKGAQYQVVQNLPFPAPGFPEQVAGMKKDEEKEFKLQFPSDYARAELAGKEASFKVRINEIKQEILPELNDEFAKLVNAEFTALDALRERVSTNLKLQAEERAKEDFEEKVIAATVEMSEAKFPSVMVEDEVSHILKHQFEERRQSMEAYLKNVKKTELEVRDELKPVAVKRVTRSLVLGKVSEEEKIEVSDAEVETEIENIVKSTAPQNQEQLAKVLKTPAGRVSIKNTMLSRKTIERLTDIAKGLKEVPVETKDTKSKKEEEK